MSPEVRANHYAPLGDVVNVDGNGRGHRQDGKFLSYQEMEMIDSNLDLIRNVSQMADGTLVGATALEAQTAELPITIARKARGNYPTTSTTIPHNTTTIRPTTATKTTTTSPTTTPNTTKTTSPNIIDITSTSKNTVSDSGLDDLLVPIEIDWVNRGKHVPRHFKPSLFNRIGSRLSDMGERIGRNRRAIYGAAAGVLAVGGFIVHESSHPTHSTANQAGATAPALKNLDTLLAGANEPTTTTTEAPKLTQAELEAKYGNVDGAHGANEIGAFNIDVNNREQSKQNFYEQLRHNSKALAFWSACLGTEQPGYGACVSDADVLANANEMIAKFENMPLDQKAKAAEYIVSQFEDATFDGITIESGPYNTVGIHGGKLVAMSNNRSHDPRLNFTFTFNGKTFRVQLRSCDQLTENITAKPTPKVVPAPAPTTTSTTIPVIEITTTTTAPANTTTTTAPTTTTSSTSTTTSSTSTTSSTIPVVTTITTPTTEVPAKNDDGNLPPQTGIPADQDKGTPDNAGDGPAVQPVDGNGYIVGGHEDKPATPAKDETPAGPPKKDGENGTEKNPAQTEAPSAPATPGGSAPNNGGRPTTPD